MGKFIEIKHSDVDQRILKKPGKNIERCRREGAFARHPLHSIKRKLQRMAKKSGPPTKRLKTTQSKTQKSIRDARKPPVEIQNARIISNISVKVFENKSTHDHLLHIPGSNVDLFLVDEQQSNPKNYLFGNIIFHIFTEIALEGLDGITLEAFWRRLKHALKNSIDLAAAKEYIWGLIRSNPKVSFYVLPSPRAELCIYDRYSGFNQSGELVDPIATPQDIYKIAVVDKCTDKGSCATYTQRVLIDVPRNMSLSEVEKEYGSKLVFVADGDLRANVLYDETSDPNYKIENVEYCILERIGRAREVGEVTQGSGSINISFNVDSRSMFYYLKHLSQNNMICKQLFLVKCQISDHNKTGRLLHLPRFYHFRKNRYMILVEEIVDILKKRPNFRMESREIREMYPTLGKVFKSNEFKRYIDSEQFVPYREMYPNARKRDYMCKSNSKEKSLKLLTLKDPLANIRWNEDMNSDSSDDEEESAPLGTRAFNVEPIGQVYNYILSKGTEGCSQNSIIENFDFDTPSIRQMLKKLLKLNVLKEKKMDRGKQRLCIFVAKCCEKLKCESTPLEPKKDLSVLERFKQKQRGAMASTEKEIYTFDRFLLDKNKVESETVSSTFCFQIPQEIQCDYFVRNIRLEITQQLKDSDDMKRLIKKLNFSIDLPYTHLSDQHFSINKSLSEIETYILHIAEFKNIPEEVHSNRYKYDLFTKVFILKAFFDELKINSEDVLNVLNQSKSTNRKRKRGPDTSDFIPEILLNDPVRKQSMKLNYMGIEPLLILNEHSDSDCSVEIVMSTVPKKYVKSMTYKGDISQLTERLVTRLNIILSTVYEEPKVFEDINKMQKHIIEKEKSEGYDKKIDRKSLSRLLQKLVSEGYIKIYKITLHNDRLTKNQTFLCHPSVDHGHPVIHTAIQQLIWRYFVGSGKRSASLPVEKIAKKQIAKKSPFDARDIVQSICELKQLTQEMMDAVETRHDIKAGKVYGYRPKFIRMRIMHEILFYLIYGYNANVKQLTLDEVRTLFKSYSITFEDEDLKKLPPIYCNEISWKMFIPPMPKHIGWQDGWTLVCDIILRIPISVLVQVHTVNFVLKELEEVLDHPIKRYYLMKNQPEIIRHAVLYKRKYLFDIHEILCRLAHCGLVQFGPEKRKEKDQTFIYLNRQASLLDTVSSEPGYNLVTEKDYRQIQFYFSSEQDIESYWYNLYNISIHTKLNQRTVMQGQTITLVDVSAKPDLVKALTAKTQAEALECDDGELLGDRRGAAGLDSSLWVHIVRNWFWAPRSSNPPPSASVMGLKKECLAKSTPVTFAVLKKNVQPPHKRVYIVSKAKQQMKKVEQSKSKGPPTKTSKNIQRINRKIKVRPKSQLKEYYDPIDKAILKKLCQARVQWTEAEDRVLLLFRAASMFLSAKTFKKQNVMYTVLRDVLHIMLPNLSKNKTSRAIQRRIHLLYVKNKDLSTVLQLESSVGNLFKDDKIFKYFAPYLNEVAAQGDNSKEPRLSIAFVILMSYFQKHMYEIERLLRGSRVTVDHLSPENLEYSAKNLIETEEEETRVKSKDATTFNEIRKNVLKSVIHSSLCNKKDHAGIVYQLFKIYQRFSDLVIRDAVIEMRQQQIISAKKDTPKGLKDQGRLHTPFQLSNAYFYAQVTTFSMQSSLETYKTFLRIQKTTREERNIVFSQGDVDGTRYGQMLAINEVSSSWHDNMIYKFYFPEHTIILNPEIEDHSEIIDKLADRYLQRLQKDMNSASEEEQEVENAKDEMEDAQLPLDLSLATGNDKTIDNLKLWVTNCMDEHRGRSPSPEFMLPLQKVATKEKKEKAVEDRMKNFNDKRLPTLDEIKTGMMDKTTSNDDRIVPYITDLTDLLSENVGSKMDETGIEQFKKHFTTQFPYLEDIELKNLEEFDDLQMTKIINAKLNMNDIWENIKVQMPFEEPKPLEDIEKMIKAIEGSEKDIVLAKAIIEFVESKQMSGATGSEIRETFLPLEDRCSLETIISVLIETNNLLRVGICTITFVHFNYKSAWLVETFSLSADEEKKFKNKTSIRKVKEDIDKRLECSMFMVKLWPWSKVDGTLNKCIFKTWLCNVMSYCLENPNVSMTALCNKFYHINPVDIFWLLEILKQLGCVEIYTIDNGDVGCFSEWEAPSVCEATCLDDFSKMYIECNNFSMTCMGSFFCKIDSCDGASKHSET